MGLSVSLLPCLYGLKKKKMHNLKVENYVLFGRMTKDQSPGDSLSDRSEGLFQRENGEARRYRSFCNKKPGSGNIKGLLLIKENPDISS